MIVGRPEGAATLVFDGDCGVCATYARWAASRLGPGATVLAWQRVDDLSLLDLDRHDVECAAWWLEGGQRWAGADAIARSLVAMRGPWSLLGWTLRLWPLTVLARLVYRWVAANRYRLPGATSACQRG